MIGVDHRHIVTAQATEHAQLGVEFSWHSDRFRQTLFVQTQGNRIDLAESLDNDDPPDWPSSPVVQQLDEVDLGEGRWGRVGVGMAGKSHYSLAVEPIGNALRFDLACRVYGQPLFLGSSYRPLEPSHATWSIEMIALHPDTAVVQRSERYGACPTVLTAISTGPRTIRWGYDIHLLPA